MNKKGFILGNLAGIVVTGALLITVNVLALSTFRSTITTYLSGSGVKKGSDISDAYTNAANVVDQIQDEGSVMLKNTNDVLPLSPKGEEDTLSSINANVFGYNTIATFYGGSGSGASSTVDAETMVKSLSDSKIVANQTVIDKMTAKADTLDKDIGNPLQGSFYPAIPEYEKSFYEAMMTEAKAYSDIAIVNIGRSAGEGMDIPSGQAGEQKDQSGKGKEVDYLSLSQNEKDLISLCETNFSKVIVVINCANPMNLQVLDDAGVDSVLWIGHPGAYGLSEVGKILRGEVNPSGRLVDTWAYDNKSAPSYYTSGAAFTYEYSNKKGSYYVDYSEGIYVGYKYYETKYEENDKAFKEAVQYPFGYGLSYTSFSWEMGNHTFNVDDNKVSVDVKVKNTGKTAGKDVVEAYYTAPYTSGGIEKSSVELADFAKTSILKPGESETVTLSWTCEDMASYDYNNANKDSHTGYELEKGDYKISLRTDSHNVKLEGFTQNVGETVNYDTSSTGYKIENRFGDATGDGTDGYDEGVKYISRKDGFTSNFPTASRTPRAASAKVLSDAEKEGVVTDNASDPLVTTETITKYVDAEKRDKDGNIVKDADGNIVYETEVDDNGKETVKKRGLYLSDMTGLSYDDPLWDDLLNQLSVKEMSDLIEYGGYQTYNVASINKGINRDLDGPQGINFSNVSGEDLKAMSYNSEIVVASTWNKDLAFREGEAFGAEANDMGVTGIYAPAMNTHRSPYGGRNYEYYSEDDVISAQIASNFVQGANTKGLNCFIKHFALNDQETHRCDNGLYTWANEQSIRELYLKPFQKAVEEGKSRCVMSSFNRIGTTWAGASYSLLTEVLRNEWGFKGMVLTDYYMLIDVGGATYGYPYMNVNTGLRAGNDCWLAGMAQFGTAPDLTSNTSKKYARNACHNILYAVTNAKATNIVIKETWLNWFIPVDVVCFLGLAAWSTLVAIKGVKANKGLKIA